MVPVTLAASLSYQVFSQPGLKFPANQSPCEEANNSGLCNASDASTDSTVSTTAGIPMALVDPRPFVCFCSVCRAHAELKGSTARPCRISNASAPIYIGTHEYQIYNQRDPPETLYRVADVYAISHEWVLVQSWKNDQDSLQSFTHTLATGFEVIEGKKTADSVSLGTIFSETGISTGHSTIDTTLNNRSPTTHDIPVQVNAYSSAYLYRKRIRYRIKAHFKLDANDWNQSRTVGAWRQGSVPLVGEYEVYVNTRDVLVVTESLSGTSVLEGPGLNGPPSSPTVQPWDRCTRKCTSWLHWCGF
ncbi:uncharacterized protein EI90DRAFT_3158811 [Cantharellus anzutake]|uniref:uncharacterized protein n=1 Tax=Cantharellus anzutake TaxID=1750568 RepID=UPI001908C81B|nr:uncharacterized protein EI90DRAFT_3158811 [Cantharellus anzutake]KAF8316966.1 hypothetical protein EI90DRAFT_3158811 [Cantharellus anzutake]